VHCRPCAAPADVGVDAQWDEIFAVVAAPETGKAVRIYHRVTRNSIDAVSLGKLAAQKLLEAGAGPLLEVVGGVMR